MSALLDDIDETCMKRWLKSGHVRLVNALNADEAERRDGVPVLRDESGRSKRVLEAVAHGRGQRYVDAAIENEKECESQAEMWADDPPNVAAFLFRQAKWNNAIAWVAQHDPTMGPSFVDFYRKLALDLLEKSCAITEDPEVIRWRDGLRATLAPSPEIT